MTEQPMPAPAVKPSPVPQGEAASSTPFRHTFASRATLRGAIAFLTILVLCAVVIIAAVKSPDVTTLTAAVKDLLLPITSIVVTFYFATQNTPSK